jgi:hypothetical protein
MPTHGEPQSGANDGTKMTCSVNRQTKRTKNVESEVDFIGESERGTETLVDVINIVFVALNALSDGLFQYVDTLLGFEI